MKTGSNISNIFAILLFVLTTCLLSVSAHNAYDPLLVAVLMVKNEEPVIGPTLEPLTECGINDFLIFDTGSTDCTVEVVQDYFKTKNIDHGYVAQEPFVDFATSRNRALKLAKEKFPNAAFFLMPDAEWYLREGKKLIEFCREHAQDNLQESPGFLMRIIGQNLDFYTARLIRGSLRAEFKGVVHETLVPAIYHFVPQDVYFDLSVTRGGIEKSQQRWVRDRDVLLREYEKNNQDTRTLFYLAQTYQCLGDLPSAVEFYQKRIALHGWREEDFMARYRLAQVVEALAYDPKSGYTWAHAHDLYLKAYSFSPHRIEPLVKIAWHYLLSDQWHIGYMVILQALQIPYPKQNALFIEKEAYEVDRYEIMSRCAWYIGEYSVGEWAARMAVKARPNTAHLEKGLAFYEGRKAALQGG